ncbi:GNAT family N-acetyltransferase [Salinactinospora qingdaonensis]|uniref:GNAT family N-acetyltransferase n=1 Tax=Salinactinospora qingdaonensis TaxID=702744 RepID=A0ABP7GD16_9ACTN
MIVREASPSEMAEVGELRIAAYRDQHLFDIDSDYPEALRVLGTDGTGHILVAAQGETILGTVLLQPWHPSASELAHDSSEAEIRALAVAPQAQGRGVGAALVHAAMRRAAADEGARRMVLSTQPTAWAAQRLYRSLGFARLPERDWSPVPGLNLLAFHRDLPA